MDKRYSLSKIYWCYSENGEVVIPIVISKNKNKIRYVQDDSVCLLDLGAVGVLTHEIISRTVEKDKGISENLLSCKHTIEMVRDYTDLVRLKGTVFAKYRGKAEMCIWADVNPLEYLSEYCKDKYVNYKGIIPFLCQLQQSIAKEQNEERLM